MKQVPPDGQTDVAYRQLAARGVVIRFLSASLPLLALALIIAHALEPSRTDVVTIMVIGLHASMTALAAWGLWHSYPHDRLGRANLVTQMRAAMAVSLSGGLLPPLSADAAWIIIAIATTSLLLDGVDGWLARRDRLASRFGARYDMEVDSFLALMLSLIAWRSDAAGPAVLLLGFPRYAFLLAGDWMPFLKQPLPQSYRRKLCCVTQIMALIVLVAPWPDNREVVWVALAAGCCLYSSFVVDIAWLWRNRR